jgi:hypothetical protein
MNWILGPAVITGAIGVGPHITSTVLRRGDAGEFAIWNIPATAEQVAATRVMNLPPNDTVDTREYIMWDPAKGRNADPVECKAIGGRMGALGPVRRCFISIKAWLDKAPGNVVGVAALPRQIG